MPHHAFSRFLSPRERLLPACVRVAAVALLLNGSARAAPSLEVEMPEGVPVGTTAVIWGFNPGNRSAGAGFTDLKAIAVGSYHAVGLREDRTVLTWGYYDWTPSVAAPPGLTDIVAVAAGSDHSLALKSDGTVIAWGLNNQLQTTVPPGLGDVAAISAAGGNGMALLRNGTVVSWGSVWDPMPANLTDVVGIAAGSRQSMAWKADGSIVLWGTGINGLPASVSGITSLAAGVNHALTLRADGSVGSWGLSSFPGRVPMPAGLSGVIQIAAGSYHAVALKSNGTVVAWGENGRGQAAVPPGLRKVKGIAAGSTRSAALVPVLDFGAAPLLAAEPARTFTVKNPGTDPLTITGVSMTGDGAAGFTLDTTGMATMVAPGGETHFSVALRPVTGGPVDAAVQIQCDDPENTVFDIHVTGTGYGPEIEVLQNPYADLGPTSPDLSFGDVDVTGARKILPFTITNTGTETLLLPAGAMVEISGSDAADFSVTQPPDASVAVGGYTTFEITFDPSAAGLRSATVSVFSNDYDENPYTFGITGTGTLAPRIAVESPDDPSAGRVVLAWGSDEAGQRTPPADTSGIVAVSAGEYHTLALRADGTVAAWGGNAEGQTDVPAGLSGVTAISAGRRHSAALKGDGTVAVWGANDHGQSNVPAGLNGIIAVSAGGSHTVALKADGTVVAWGSNDYGQLTAPPGLIATAIAAGGNHTVALTATGRVLAWGLNSSNQLNMPASLTDVVRISAGETSSSTVRSNGSAVSWGYGVAGPYSWAFATALEGGGGHAVALLEDGTVSSWGNNTKMQATVPTGLAGVSAVAAGGTHTVALPLTGDYGVVAPGVPAGKTYTIRNTGSSDLAISSVTLSGDAGVFSMDTTGMLTVIPPGGSTTFTGRFLTPSGGIFRSVIRVASSDKVHPSYDVYQIARGAGPEIALTGRSVNIPNGTTAPRAADFTDFGEVNLSVTAEREFSVINSGTVALDLTGTAPVTITGPDADAFSVTLPPPATVPPAGTVRFRIAFHPSEVRTYAANLSIANNDTDEAPFSFAIQGTGVAGPMLAVEFPDPSATAVMEYGITFPDQALRALTGLKAVAAGSNYSAALRDDGTVLTWPNSYSVPIDVPAGLSDVREVAVGTGHGLALRTDGTVQGWGAGSDWAAAVPAGLGDVQSISAWEYRLLAVKGDGTVVGWGKTGPTPIPYGLSGVVAAAPGTEHSVALKSDGTVAVWGSNSLGQLNVPPGLTGVVAVAAADDYSLALRSDGQVAVWGSYRFSPSAVTPGLADVVAISPDLVLTRDGSLVSWKTGHPQDSGLHDVKAFASVPYHTLAIVPAVDFGRPAVGVPLSQAVTIRNRGSDTLTITGLTLTGLHAAGFQLDTAGTLMSIPAGGNTSVIVRFPNSSGAICNAALRIVSNDPVRSRYDVQLRATAIGPEIGLLGGTLDIASGDMEPSVSDSTEFGTTGIHHPVMREFTVINTGTQPLHLTGSERVSISGEHAADFSVTRQPVGEVGTGTDYSRFQIAFTPTGAGLRRAVVSVQSDDFDEGSYSFAIQGTAHTDPEIEVSYTPDGSLEALLWAGTLTVPVFVHRELADLTAISSGKTHGLMLRANGTVVTWGTGSDGQTLVPAGLKDVTRIAAGSLHSVALTRNGEVVAWGSNGSGQCNIPPDLGEVIEITAGGTYTAALSRDGVARMWRSGSLVEIPGIVAIKGDYYRVLALHADGRVSVSDGWSVQEIPLPADMSGMTSFAGGFPYVAVRPDGTVGHFGPGDARRAPLPVGITDAVTVSADTVNFSSAAANYMVLRRNGRVVTARGQNLLEASLRDITAIEAEEVRYSALRRRTFPNLDPGMETPPKTFTITNTGASTLELNSVGWETSGSGFFLDTSRTQRTVAPGASTTFTVSFVPASSGAYERNLVITGNAAPSTLAVTGYARDFSAAETAYRSWAANAGLTGADALPLATPQGDGVANLLKFAFNMDPKRPDSTILTPGTGYHGLPAISIGGFPGARTLRIEYVRRRYSSPVYTPRVGTSLDAMEPVTAAPVVSIIDSEWERVVVSHPLGNPVPERIFGLVSVGIPE